MDQSDMVRGAGESTRKIRACAVVAGIAAWCIAAPAGATRADSWLILPVQDRSDGREMAQGWAWQAQREGAPDMQSVSGIPKDGLAVAWFTQPDKLTYLGIHGKGLEGATLRLKVDNDSNNLNIEEAELQACLIIHEWTPAKPMAWEQKPITGCDKPSPGRYQRSKGTFVFDLTPLARALTTLATYGISIEPVEEPTSNFQAVFKGGDSVVVRKSSGGNRTSSVPSGGQGGNPDGAVGTSNGGGGAPSGASSIEFGSPPAPVSNEGGPAFDSAEPPIDVGDPVDVSDAAPTSTEQEPATFAWVYLALVAGAVFQFITRVLAYSLPARRPRGKRR